MPQSIGDQIAWAVHQGQPTGADANTAQLIAIMQMLSKAGEHTRDIAQWWDERPIRKQRRDEALRANLFQEVAKGNGSINDLGIEGRVQLRAIQKADNPYTNQGVNDAIAAIKPAGGNRLASNGAALTGGDAAEAIANIESIDSILSTRLDDLKDRPGNDKIKSEAISNFVTNNPSAAAALYIKAMKSVGSNPAALSSLSSAQQAMIEASSTNGPESKTINNTLNGLLLTQTMENGVKKVTASPLLKAMTENPKGTTDATGKVVTHDTRGQAAILTHLNTNSKGAGFANKFALYDNAFPTDPASGKYYNAYTEKFETGREIEQQLNDNPKFKGWAIESSLRGEKQALPDLKSKSGEVPTSYENQQNLLYGSIKEQYGIDASGSLPFMNQNSIEGIAKGIGVADQAVSKATGYIGEQAANARDATRQFIIDNAQKLPGYIGDSLDQMPTLPDIPRQKQRASIPPGGMDAMSGDYPMRSPVDNGLKGLNLESLNEQEQRALFELLSKLKSGVGAQQSPASGQYPGMGYGLRVR